ncbi:unnamed protein product, partial [Ixodes persulcatus]
AIQAKPRSQRTVEWALYSYTKAFSAKSTLSSQGEEHTDKLSQIYTVHCFHVGNYYNANSIIQKLPVTREMKKKTADKIILQYPSLLWWYMIHEGCCVTLCV